MNRESVITNMKVSDADVVKAANSGFYLERRCCRTTTGLISSQTVCRVAGGFPGKDDEQEGPVMQGLRDDVARGLDDGWSQGSRTVTVLDAGVSASMITKQEVLTDQQHKGGDARE